MNVDFFDGIDGEVSLAFNATPADPIGDVSGADPLKWTARYGGVAYAGSSMSNLGFNGIAVHFTASGPEAGPNVIGYSNAPSDVGDARGRMLAAFSGMALP